MIKPLEKDGIILERQEIGIDDKIIGRMERDYKLNIDRARQEIKQNKFTSNTTIYYLLLKRHERVGILRQQFQIDLQRKKPKVQMILDQQQQQDASMGDNNQALQQNSLNMNYSSIH